MKETAQLRLSYLAPRLVFAAGLVVLQGCYVMSQAFHQGNLLAKRRTVKEVIEDENVDASVKTKLNQVKQILTFAEAKGLKTRGAYEKYIDIGSKPVSYLVQASEADKFKFITWWFPIVGTVPYLGYFKIDDRDRFAEELGSQGHDVHKTVVGAFSGLGWFEDPIFSSMIRTREYSDLALLFFHELTHRTIWIPGKVRVNESFAEFVGIELTRQFLTSQTMQEELLRFEKEQKEERVFVDWVLNLKDELEKNYGRAPEVDRDTILKEKQRIIERHVESSSGKFGSKRGNWIKSRTWNNASIMAISLYHEDLPLMEEAFSCSGQGDIQKFIRTVKTIDQADLDANKIRDYLCKKQVKNVD
jgi:predicted aminopeptidase